MIKNVKYIKPAHIIKVHRNEIPLAQYHEDRICHWTLP
jgi:hypothetical protein